MADEKHPALRGVEERERVAREQVDLYYKQDAQNRPTPSQAENDAAKVGQPAEQLEPDGSPPEAETVDRILTARSPNNQPYDTRALEAGEPGAEQPRRGPGRPAKAEAARGDEKK
jgi:hypothetical protein